MQAFVIEAMDPDMLLCAVCKDAITRHADAPSTATDVRYGVRCEWCGDIIGCTCRHTTYPCEACREAARTRRDEKRRIRAILVNEHGFTPEQTREIVK